MEPIDTKTPWIDTAMAEHLAEMSRQREKFLSSVGITASRQGHLGEGIIIRDNIYNKETIKVKLKEEPDRCRGEKSDIITYYEEAVPLPKDWDEMVQGLSQGKTFTIQAPAGLGKSGLGRYIYGIDPYETVINKKLLLIC